MNRIIEIYNKTKKNGVPGLVWVLSACLVVVIAALIFMPEAQAENLSTLTWNEDSDDTDGVHIYNLGDISGSSGIATINVEAGGKYIINGDKNISLNGVHIKFSYSGADSSASTQEGSTGDVTVILRDVNMTRSYDEPLIAFTTSNNSVNYHVTIENECNLSSNISGTSLTPVIAVENMQYSILKLSEPSIAYSWEDYITSMNTIRNVNLYLNGANTESKLTISEMTTDSYGAVIGSGESVLMQTKLDTASAEEKAKLEYELNNSAMGESKVTVNDPTWLDAIEKLGFVVETGAAGGGSFLPQYKYGNASVSGSGRVIIGGADGSKPLRINIVSNSYGAAIGGGAGKAEDSSAASAQKVTINAGTVYINSSKAGVDAIGTGYSLNGTSTFSGVEINGGSINIVSGGKLFTKDPVNAKGYSLYLVKADTTQNTEEKFQNLQNLAINREIPLNYTYAEGLKFVDLDKVTDTYVAREVLADKGTTDETDDETINIVDVTVNLSDASSNAYTYRYEGTGHSNVTASEEILYFYLPATEVTYLYITDNFGIGTGEQYPSYIVKNANTSDVIEPDSVDSSFGRKYVLPRGNTYYIVPTAPTKPVALGVTSASVNGANATSTANGYTIQSNQSAISAVFSYGGDIEIVYEDGLLDTDRSNHSIVLPERDYTYGTDTMTIAALGTFMKPNNKTVKDLIFDGWLYVKENGDTGKLTAITKDNTDGNGYVAYTDLLWADGTIHVRATWQVEISYVLDTDATMTDEGKAQIKTVTMAYGSGTDNKVNITLPTEDPKKSGYMFEGWLIDTGGSLADPVQLSTLTSHKITSLFEKDGFRVYIDASELDFNTTEFFCVSSTNEANQLLETDGNGDPKLIDVDGTKYYRTVELYNGNEVKILVQTETGYFIKTITIEEDTTKCSTDVGETNYDIDTGNYYVDFVIGKEDVFVKIDADIEPLEFKVTFTDGKTPDEQLWSEYTFYYTIDDIENGTTIGDIIRRGFGRTEDEMPDSEIVKIVNAIEKNDGYTRFAGWTNVFMTGTYGSSLAIKDVFEENANLTYGPLTFTAAWKEQGKVRLNLTILERNFLEGDAYEDTESTRYTGKLYYKLDDGTMELVPTEIETDPETGEEMEIAFASPNETLYIEVYEMDEDGEPTGKPITQQLDIVQLYYLYESIRGEDGYINVHTDPLTSFNVEDEAVEGSTVEVYLVYAVKKYKIIYWNLYGHDNSMNPTEFTVYDEFDFVPIADGVNWLLVCMDTDISNDNEVKKEVITGVALGGKPVTDGTAGNRDYVSNLVLMPDWTFVEEEEDEYTITIIVDGEEYGEVTVAQPSNASSYMAEQLILLSALAKEGYELVPETLVCVKDESRATYSLARGVTLLSNESGQIPLQVVNAEDGMYLFTMPESDVIVYATFKVKEYNIVYEQIEEDALNPNPDKYNITSNILLEGVEKEGYTFEGWYDVDGNKVESIADRTGDIVLIAKYLENEIIQPIPEPADPIEIAGRPSNIIVSSNTYRYEYTYKPVQTGDNTDVPRLVLICVAAVLILLIVIIKKPRKDEEEEQNGIDTEVNTTVSADSNEKK